MLVKINSGAKGSSPWGFKGAGGLLFKHKRCIIYNTMAAKGFPSHLELIQAEEALLLVAQEDQAHTLERVGILDTARELLVDQHFRHLRILEDHGHSDTYVPPLTNDMRAAISYHVPNPFESPEMQPAIRFTGTVAYLDGIRTYHHYVPMIDPARDMDRGFSRFSDFDVRLARSMIGGLLIAREKGILPHLTPDLASIDGNQPVRRDYKVIEFREPEA
ncbi:MAG: hypothetical protein JWM81_221 [Candidatus Saccharibacteria bacterium]|nr:hypothetical protein [Candidatus Saccharibacteria bacterium]